MKNLDANLKVYYPFYTCRFSKILDGICHI